MRLGMLLKYDGAKLAPTGGHELFDLHLADEVTGAIGRLLQVQMLFAANGIGVEPQPSARRVGGRELRRLFERRLVGVHPEVAERPRR